MPRSAAVPVSLGDNFALYHPSFGDTGYVICGAWGFAELCSRKFLRILADELAETGFPVLRIDYPGTCNMLDPKPDSGLDGWIQTAVDAAKRLQEISGCRRVLFFGLNIGSTVALMASQALGNVEGVILADPVFSGRRFIRELQLHAQMTVEGLGVALSGKTGDTGFSGFKMTEKLQADLKAINVGKLELTSSPHCLVLMRTGDSNDIEMVDTIEAKGCQVEREIFNNYAELMATPATSIISNKVIADIIAWSQTHFEPQKGPDIPAVRADARPVILNGEGFTEQPVTFGPDNRYFGILCRPKDETTAPVAVFLNAAYNHTVGWGRIWVRAARYLAARGIPSFRFDFANIGETPPTEGEPDRILYTSGQSYDLKIATDYLTETLPNPIFLVGRCLGAWASFHYAHSDPRIRGMMLINQLTLVQKSDYNIDEALVSGARPMEEYRHRARSLSTLKRLVTGQVDVVNAGRHILSHLNDRIAHKFSPYLGNLTETGRNRRTCLGIFETHARRSVPIYIVNCENDGSLDEFASYFGADFSGLKAYPNVTQTIIPNADHNLTPENAQQDLLKLLEEVLLDPRWSDRQAIRSQAAE